MQDRKRTVCVRGVQGSLACTCLHSLSSAERNATPQSDCSAQASSAHQQAMSTQLADVLRKLSRAQEILYNECLVCTGENSPSSSQRQQAT
jgi:hypothetical protein